MNTNINNTTECDIADFNAKELGKLIIQLVNTSNLVQACKEAKGERDEEEIGNLVIAAVVLSSAIED